MEKELKQNKKETLEEFSRRRFNEQKLDTYTSYNIEDAIKEGAKWQQKQDKNLYSEEDLLKFGAFVRIEDKKEKRLFLIQDYFKKWFNQFKKK